MASFVLSDKLREHLVFTAIGLTLAGLGTVATLCVSYLLTFSERLNSEVRKEEYAFKEYAAKATRRKELLTALKAATERSSERLEGPVEDILLEGKKNAANDLRNIYESGLRGAAEDLAQLSGYSPDTTGLPEKNIEGMQASLKAEIEFWHFVGKNVGGVERGRGLSREAMAELRDRLFDMRYGNSAVGSAVQDANAWADFQSNLQKQQLEAVREEIHTARGWSRLALGAVFGIILVFYFVLRLAAFKKEPEAPTTPIKQ